MHLIRAVTLLLVTWPGPHAASKPTPADPAHPAPGPHDDPWAHTYRAAASAPAVPTLQLRGFQTQQPEQPSQPTEPEPQDTDGAGGPAAATATPEQSGPHSQQPGPAGSLQQQQASSSSEQQPTPNTGDEPTGQAQMQPPMPPQAQHQNTPTTLAAAETGPPQPETTTQHTAETQLQHKPYQQAVAPEDTDQPDQEPQQSRDQQQGELQQMAGPPPNRPQEHPSASHTTAKPRKVSNSSAK